MMVDPLAVPHEQMVGRRGRGASAAARAGERGGRRQARRRRGRTESCRARPRRAASRRSGHQSATSRHQRNRTTGRSSNGVPGSARGHDEVRHAESLRDGGAVAVVPVEQLHDPGRLAELAARASSSPGQSTTSKSQTRPSTSRACEVRRIRCSSIQPAACAISSTTLTSAPAARTPARRPRRAARPARAAAGRARRPGTAFAPIDTPRGSSLDPVAVAVAREHVVDVVQGQPDGSRHRRAGRPGRRCPAPRPSTRPSAGRAAPRACRDHARAR